MNAWNELGVDGALGAAVLALGFDGPTPIQAAALPHAMAGRDVIGLAETGTGKTAAYGLAALKQIDIYSAGPQVLVMVPARELGIQVAATLRALARRLPRVQVVELFGGMPSWPQVKALNEGPQVVVATPGRLVAHLKAGALGLDCVRCVVLDEGDRLLDQGFEAELETVREALPESRQTMCFSATWAEGVEASGERWLRDPVRVGEAATAPAAPLTQYLAMAMGRPREEALAALLSTLEPGPTLVFVRTRAEAASISEALWQWGCAADGLHADRSQEEREAALVRLADESVRVLVATDVAARGLDLPELARVVVAELSGDFAQHTHRVGRVARAGREGQAYVLVCAEHERLRAESVQAEHGQTWKPVALPQGEPDLSAWRAMMCTLSIEAGRKDKLRPTDVLGALTAEGGVAGSVVGKIRIGERRSYVSVQADSGSAALKALKAGVKGRRLLVERLR